MQTHRVALKLVPVLLLSLLACDCLPQRPTTSHDGVGEHQQHATNPTNPTTSPKCGYKSCPKTDPKRLNVHIIAHSHDDVGWLKTVDQYYYGSKKGFSGAGVQYILDSVVSQLLMDSSKRFIYVEMSFFYKWWEEQDANMRKLVRQLVNEGQLEFINGGWCMNDEATVSYHSTIEQMTLGLKFLNETFGQCGRPKVGWQIDPFGHTNEQASLFAQFGFDGMFFTRIGYEDKMRRVANKSLDIIWHGDAILQGQSGSIYTNIFKNGYDAPDGLCFDALCHDDPIIDNEKSYEFNVDYKGRMIINYIKQYAKAKLTNHVLIPFGGDFQFSSAGQNFKSIDKLMKYVRNHAPEMNIFYSTPSCYQFAIHETINQRDRKINLPEKYNDFMPYDSSQSVWWSGYFSSRPSVKLIERELSSLLQVVRLASLENLVKQQQQQQVAPEQSAPSWSDAVKSHDSKCLRKLWEIHGDLQHHDAITGTEKQHVADDYVRRASDATKLCSKFLGELNRKRFNQLLSQSQDYEPLRRAGRKYHLDAVYLEDTMFCPLLNISQCDALESDVNVHHFHNYELDKLHHSTSQAPHQPMSAHPKIAPLPKELETKGVLMTVYNPLAKPVNQIDLRLPCNGRCDLDKVQIIQVATNETMKLVRLPVPAGVTSLPFRDAITTYEVLFYANLAPLSSTNFVITDENVDELINEEADQDGSILITDETSRSLNQFRSRRTRRALTTRQNPSKSRHEPGDRFANSNLAAKPNARRHDQDASIRFRRQSGGDAPTAQQQAATPDRVIVKFDMSTGVIQGLRRASDKSFVNLTQRFGFYAGADNSYPPGAYIFRPNSSEPHFIDKPISFRMYKRQNGALIEIHQKWADWIWQTIRVDSRKNYIEFDYVVGPVPVKEGHSGREVITRYQTNIANDGIFLTDSNSRQLLLRKHTKKDDPAELGGSFYPVVSTLMIKNHHPNRASRSADAVSILVDRPQAGTSLNEGDLELLIHRRLLRDDNFGVAEALNEPGDDGRGLVTRGKHRFYFKFHDQAKPDQSNGERAKLNPPTVFLMPRKARENVTFESILAQYKCGPHCPVTGSPDLHIVNDKLLNDIRQESVKNALRPILTFDRLRVTAREFMQMLTSGDQAGARSKTDASLLNMTLPDNVHLLTLQPWDGGSNQLLIRLENLDNPLTLHSTFSLKAHKISLEAYKTAAGAPEIQVEASDPCSLENFMKAEVDIEYLINNVRIVSLNELNLGANNRLADDKRLDWTQQQATTSCDSGEKQTTITLRPRQIRTFLASFEQI